jgi:hypothetical protein
MNQQSAGVADRGTLATGIVGAVTMIVFFVISEFTGTEPPPADAESSEYALAVNEHLTAFRWDVGLRFFVLFAVFVPFSLGLARHVRGGSDLARMFAAMIPLAAASLVAIGGTANTLLGTLVFEHERLASYPELTRMLYLGVNGLFLLAMLPHGMIIGCTSIAGWLTRSLPAWLCGLGVLHLLASVVAVVWLPSSLGLVDEGGAAGFIAVTTYMSSSLWYLLVSIVLIVKWWRTARPSPALDEPNTTRVDSVSTALNEQA